MTPIKTFSSKATPSDIFIDKHLSSTGFFVLDTDYTLPYVVSKALSLKNKVIKAGKYKVIATSDTYVLSF